MKNKKRKGHIFTCAREFADFYVNTHNKNNSYNKITIEYLKSLPNYEKGITQMMHEENKRRKLNRLEATKISTKASHSQTKCTECGTVGSKRNIKNAHFENCAYPIIEKNIESCLPIEVEFSITELINNLKEKTGLSSKRIETELKKFFIVKGGKSPVKGSSSNISYQKWIYKRSYPTL